MKLSLNLIRIRPLVRLLQILARFVDRSLGVVVGLHRLPVFVDRPVALAGDIKDLPQRDVAPDLGPLRLVVSAQRIAIGIGGRLVVALR